MRFSGDVKAGVLLHYLHEHGYLVTVVADDRSTRVEATETDRRHRSYFVAVDGFGPDAEFKAAVLLARQLGVKVHQLV